MITIEKYDCHYNKKSNSQQKSRKGKRFVFISTFINMLKPVDKLVVMVDKMPIKTAWSLENAREK